MATPWIAVADMVSEWPHVMLQQSMHLAGGRRHGVRCDPLTATSGNRVTRDSTVVKTVLCQVGVHKRGLSAGGFLSPCALF